MPRTRLAYQFTTQEANARYERLVYRYGYKPTPIISYRNRESHSALPLGVEVECEFNPNSYTINALASAAQSVYDIADGRVYLKRDGSVPYGFEIVSHPATLASHMYDAHWSGIFSKCVKHGMRSHDAKTWNGSCGLHVHVGRAALGNSEDERDDVVRKVKVLVYRHWEEMERFSRRSWEQLDDWASRELSNCDIENIATSNYPDVTASRCIPTTNSHNDRYIAVNCENAATIEFRLFNGTLKRDTFMATLQLCSNICKYAMSHEWSDILSCDFLKVALYERYNEIETYLVARGLADETCTGRVQNTTRIYDHGGTDGV